MPLDEDVPEFWDVMPANTSCLAVPIAAGVAEHTEVLNLFRATCQQNVIKVDCIYHGLSVCNYSCFIFQIYIK